MEGMAGAQVQVAHHIPDTQLHAVGGALGHLALERGGPVVVQQTTHQRSGAQCEEVIVAV